MELKFSRKSAHFVASASLLFIASLSPGLAVYMPPPATEPLPFKTVMPPAVANRSGMQPGRILIQLKSGVDAAHFFANAGLNALDSIPDLGVYVVETTVGHEEEAARQLGRLGDVEYAEPDRLYYEMSLPNDPYFSKYQWNLQKANFPEAWDYSTGSGVVIAVLDTGADLQHPDLKGKIAPGSNFVRPGALPQDDEGHGSHVSGIAAAATDNGVGIAGAGWGARVMPVKVLGSDGSGSTSVIARGITWATDHGAKILNMSLGSSSYTSTLKAAVQYAVGKGLLVVVAAGNDYLNGNPIDYPAAFPGVMAVGASNYDGEKASYSESADYVSVVAPGGDPTSDRDPNANDWILSSYPSSIGGAMGDYEEVAGTSQATPVVSGLAALIWSLKPDFTADQVKNVIEKTAVDLGPAGRDPDTGYGLVDAEAALASIAAPANGGSGIVAPPATIAGDLNGDGATNVADATLALKIAVGLVQPTASQIAAGDVYPAGSPDGVVNVSDATRILRSSVGLDPLAGG
jgi:subtilisin family serine protease